MSKRRRYDDKFRASAVVMLEAAGYPDKDGALARVARELKVPESTLHGWANNRNTPPSQMRTIKRVELNTVIREEIYSALEAAQNVRQDASYRDLITGAAILIDKLQLLEGQPTWRIEVINLIKSGEFTPQDIINELGDTPEVRGLLESAGTLTIEGRAAQVEVTSENSAG